MLTYDEALARVLAQTDPLPAETVSVATAYGRALSEPIVAAENLPPFDNSAVDGYAVGEYENQLRKPVGQVLAGQEPNIAIGSGDAVYVATGAMIPIGTIGIVMIEDVSEGIPGF
ncbi:MAG: hypothetical protein H8F28_16520 [Fibrella sp.]|nr:hypothetical protein [Armatimonadota bacterium]